MEKIRAHEIPLDALVWYEGLPDWMPIISLEAFKVAFEDSEDPTTVPLESPVGDQGPVYDGPETKKPAQPLKEERPTPAAKPNKAKKKDEDAAEASVPSATFSFASGTEDLAPVFKEEEGEAPRGFVKRRLAIIACVFVILGGGTAAYFFLSADQEEPLPPPRQVRFPRNPNRGAMNGRNQPGARTISGKPGTVKPPVTAPVKPPPNFQARQTELRRAESQLLLDPDKSLATMKKLIVDYPDDAVAKEALETAVTYYKQNLKYTEAGRLMMQAHRPSDAAKLFLSDPPSYQEAEAALFAAYQASHEPSRRDLLLQDIQLLLGPLSNPDLGVERIKLLEKDFPNEPHPYGYYLKSQDEKIADLFSRISFYFVQSLMQYFSTEMPQINLVKRPVVEVIRDKEGKYRIVGKYKGDVAFNRDHLSGISFVFWMNGENWVLVDTDVTTERKRFARAEYQRLRDKAVDGKAMLDFLQNIFHQKFPKSAYHEQVRREDAVGKKDTVE